jgi:hypothetical protein
MPHIVMELWPGKSEEQKARLKLDIQNNLDQLYKKPGYDLKDLEHV